MAISRMQQPRQMYQDGSIMPRLNQLGSGVSSAEQMLQGINQRLESAESSLGEGGGNTALIGSGPMQLAGGATQQPAFGSMEEAYSSFQDKAKDIRAGGMLGRVVLPGEMSFQDFSNNMNLNTGFFGMHGAGGVPVGGNSMQSPISAAMRNMAAGGGMMGRQMYGLGSLVKKAVKGVTGAVKKIAKSDLGKAALLYAGTAGLGSLAGGGGLGSLFKLGTYAPSAVFGNLPGIFSGEGLKKIGGAFGLKSGADNLLGNTLKVGAYGTALGGALAGMEGEEEASSIGGERNVEALRTRLTKAYRELRYPEEQIPALVEADLAEYTSGAGGYAEGGRIGYAMGDSAEQNAMQASGIMGLPLNQNPAGVTELDLRETGGFIPPVGVKEKEDDIPAMLSNNEFVFTADAVRGMGDGDVNKGAQRMYDMMKKLENGGRV
jgi:hypothetical protein